VIQRASRRAKDKRSKRIEIEVSFSRGETLKGIGNVRVEDNRLYFILFFILDLELGVSMTSHVTVTNFHSHKSHNHIS